MPHSYRLFGGILHSDLELPELLPTHEQAASWVLRCLDTEPGPHGDLLGTDTVNADVSVALYRQPAGFRLHFDDTGCFDVSANGQEIWWHRTPGVDLAHARIDLTSRVLATALHAAGSLCFHASAVALGDCAIGFLAPKRHGKSTLALALVQRGARLLTDDTLPVEPGPPSVARPGFAAARIWPDSAARVGLRGLHSQPTGEKLLLSGLPDEQVQHEPVPLAALYILTPERTRAPDGAATWCSPLSPVRSALSLISQAKLAPLLGRLESAHLMSRTAAIARHVPVQRLHVVRDLDRLDEVAGVIESWHVQPVPTHS